MPERVRERGREPEPTFSNYEFQLKRYADLLNQSKKGKKVVRWRDLPWEKSRQGSLKYYCTEAIKDVAAIGWAVFQQRITKHSGKHIHQGGLVIYVIDGKGYTIIDGVRYDWKKGDLIVLPFKPGGVEHQHFNDSPDKPAHWVAFRFYPWMDFVAGSITQVETHEDWRKK